MIHIHFFSTVYVHLSLRLLCMCAPNTRAVRFRNFWNRVWFRFLVLESMGFDSKNRFLCCFRFFFDSCFLDWRNLISPWLQDIKVVESILLIIWSFICKKKKKEIHFYSSDWFLNCNFVCISREISHSSLLSRDVHLSHELNKTWSV